MLIIIVIFCVLKKGIRRRRMRKIFTVGRKKKLHTEKKLGILMWFSKKKPFCRNFFSKVDIATICLQNLRCFCALFCIKTPQKWQTISWLICLPMKKCCGKKCLFVVKTMLLGYLLFFFGENWNVYKIRGAIKCNLTFYFLAAKLQFQVYVQ